MLFFVHYKLIYVINCIVLICETVTFSGKNWQYCIWKWRLSCKLWCETKKVRRLYFKREGKSPVCSSSRSYPKFNGSKQNVYYLDKKKEGESTSLVYKADKANYFGWNTFFPTTLSINLTLQCDNTTYKSHINPQKKKRACKIR